MVEINHFSLSRLATAMFSNVTVYENNDPARDYMYLNGYGNDGDRFRFVVARHAYANSDKALTHKTAVETEVLLATISKMQELDKIVSISLFLPRDGGELRFYCTTPDGNRIFIVPAVDYEKAVATLFPPEVDETPDQQFVAALRHSAVVDQPKGSYKKFRDPDNPALQDYPLEGVTYPVDYGYLPGYIGSDGEGLDVFLGSDLAGEYGKFHVYRPDLQSSLEMKYYLGLSHKELLDVLYAFGPVITGGPYRYDDTAALRASLDNFKL